MDRPQLWKGVVPAIAVLAVWLGVKYLLPVLLPFALGMLLAVAAEPVVQLGIRRFRLPRGVAAGLGVSLTLVLLVGILSVLGALAVKELGVVAGSLPDVQQGMTFLQDKLVSAAQSLPEGVRGVATGGVLELFDGGGMLLKQVSGGMTKTVKSALGWLTEGALGVGTGILAGFMISARLPRLRKAVAGKIPEQWRENYLPALQRVKGAVWQWLKAQGKLMGLTYLIVALGLTVMGVRYGLFWAILVALVDAIPVLGTGTVLVPWAVVELMQGQTLRGIGLLGVYAGAMLTRTILEPRLVGRHLGLDPLLTLVFLYVGYRFFGIFGMILAPLLATAVKAVEETKEG